MGKAHQGQSILVTEEKARGFCSVFEQQIAVVQATQKKWLRNNPYVHIDLHAGSGFNDEVNVVGSPLLFCDIARRHGFENYLLLCSEHDKGRVKQLANRLAENQRAYPFYGDNRELCYALPELLKSWGFDLRSVIGSVLVDPNSVKEQFCWEALEYLFQSVPRLDCIFNYPATAFKRAKKQAELYFHLEDIPQKLHKSVWFIREPIAQWQFTCLLGRNTDKISSPGQGFKAWDSQDGIRYRKRATLTAEEYELWSNRYQLQLFKV